MLEPADEDGSESTSSLVLWREMSAKEVEGSGMFDRGSDCSEWSRDMVQWRNISCNDRSEEETCASMKVITMFTSIQVSSEMMQLSLELVSKSGKLADSSTKHRTSQNVQ